MRVNFKARMKDGSYLQSFRVSKFGQVIVKNSAGVDTVEQDAELIVITNDKHFCYFCGAKK